LEHAISLTGGNNNVDELFSYHVVDGRYRDNTAVVNVERDRRYTFPEYHCLTNRIANMARCALSQMIWAPPC
jgi:hypothetical protein